MDLLKQPLPFSTALMRKKGGTFFGSGDPEPSFEQARFPSPAKLMKHNRTPKPASRRLVPGPILCLGAFFALFTTAHAALLGDADGNGVVDMNDAYTIMRYLTHQIPSVPNPAAADVTQDGKIDMDDAFTIAKKVSGQSMVVGASVQYAQGQNIQIGDTAVFRVFEHFSPFQVTSGTARITSASTGYDSGNLPLSFEQDGRSQYLQMPTSGLSPASDYQVKVTLQKPEGAQSVVTTAAITAQIPEPRKNLVKVRDLFLPYMSVGLQFTRYYSYSSHFFPYTGSLGRGWNHEWGIQLTEYTDGSVMFFDNNGDGHHFVKTGPGAYASLPGDNNILTRDADGTFQLWMLDGAHGRSYWHFRSDLRADIFRDLNGNNVALAYDSQGRLVSVTDGSGQQIAFTIDGQNRITAATDSTGRSVNYAYDASNNLSTVTDPLGKTTAYAYDAQQRLIQINYPDGRQRVFTYGQDGRLSAMSWAGGLSGTTFAYNTANVNSVDRIATDAMGRSRHRISNAAGFVMQTTDGVGNTTSLQRDGQQRFTGKTDALGSHWAVVSDSMNKPLQIADPHGSVQQYAYSTNFHKKSSFTDAKLASTTCEYDETGNPTKAIYADGSVAVNFTSDKSGTRVVNRQLRSGQSNQYAYNPRGQLISKTLADGSQYAYAYDDRGNMTSASGPAGIILKAYDVLGRATSTTYPGNRTFLYQYDEMSRRTQMTNPDGRVLQYAYDSTGKMTFIKDSTTGVMVQYRYDLSGKRTQKTMANGITTSYAYNAAGRVTGIVNQNGANVISSVNYQYDALGNRAKITDLSGVTSCAFDSLSQLTSITRPDSSNETFGYDAAGNRASAALNGISVAYTANVLNQYTVVGGLAYGYDLNGNLVSMQDGGGTTAFQYDPENRLISVQRSSGQTVSYTYDALGRLASRTDSGGSVYFLWDGLQMAIEETSAHVTTASYTWGARLDEIVSMRRGSANYFYEQDALNTVTDLSNSSGVIIEQYAYSAFGDTSSASSVGNRFFFTGGMLDAATGLTDLRARWYAAKLGRFLQVDPIGLAGGENLYLYASNNPLRFVDPFGHCSSDDSEENNPFYDVTDIFHSLFDMALEELNSAIESALDLPSDMGSIENMMESWEGLAAEL